MSKHYSVSPEDYDFQVRLIKPEDSHVIALLSFPDSCRVAAPTLILHPGNPISLLLQANAHARTHTIHENCHV